MIFVWWVGPFAVHLGSLMSVVPRSAALPILVDGVEVWEASSFSGVMAAEESGIWGAETWRISLSGTQIRESASCGKIAYPRQLVNNGSGPFHCPGSRSLHFTSGFAFDCSRHQWRSIAVFLDESAFKLFITKRACCKI